MGRPLLTDEMIERANRGEDISGPPLHDEEEAKNFKNDQKSIWLFLSCQWLNQDTLQIDVEPTVTKADALKMRNVEYFKRN